MADALHAPWVLGLLYSAGFVGSLLATLTGGWTRRIYHHGRAILVAAVVWGVSIAAFGLARNLWLALLFLGAAGAATW